jgi:hypothetical protein
MPMISPAICLWVNAPASGCVCKALLIDMIPPIAIMTTAHTSSMSSWSSVMPPLSNVDNGVA